MARATLKRSALSPALNSISISHNGLERLPVSSYRRPLLGTGLCGGLTTFSTMHVEIVRMLEQHHYGLAVGYIAASLAAGLLALYLATALVRRAQIRA